MTTAYTSLLGLALPVTGELSGTWGDTVNNSITSLLDTSVAGTTNVSTDTDVTLTTTTGAANTARQAILLFSGARTALRTVTAPAQSKVYTVINATTGGFSVKLVGAGPTTGLTIPNGASAVVAWNGSDFVEIGAGSIGNLVVNGTLTVTGATTLQSTLAVTGNITNTAGTANGVTYLNGSKVLTSGSALVFDGTNLGVGTSNPAAFGLFVINGASASANINASTGSAALKFYEGSGTGRGSITSLNGSDGLAFLQGTTEGMRLTSTGLGIGTSSPAYKLDVVGSATNVAKFQNGSNQSVFIASASGLSGILSEVANQNGWLMNSASNYVVAYTNGGEKLRLDSSGNLGLGVTPSAWYTSFGTKAFQFAASGSLAGLDVSSSDRRVYLMNNAFIGGAGNFVYLNTGAATQYQQTAGAHQWYNAPSGTAGNTITFTQAMTLDASGNLGIATTSPVSKLNILVALETSFAQTNDGITLRASSGSTGRYTLLNFSGSGYAGNVAQIGGVTTAIGSGYSDSSGALVFTTKNTTDSVPVERARIDSSGNFGIGTSSPAAKLHIGVPDASVDGTKGVKISNPAGTTVVLECGVSSDSFVGTTSGSDFFIRTNNTERLKFPNAGGVQAVTTISVGNATPSATGAGITFPATQSASSNANTLDDYEQGSWTPGIDFSGGTTGITYSRQVGRYTKIGNMVYVNGSILLSNKGSSSGVVRISGLPFTPGGAVSTLYPCVGINVFGLDTTRQVVLQVNYSDGGFPVELKLAGTDTGLTNSECTNTSDFRFMFFYFSAD